MKLSKYIELLQRTLKYEGDLEVVQSDVDNVWRLSSIRKSMQVVSSTLRV